MSGGAVFSLQVVDGHRVLLVTFGTSLTDDIYLAAYQSIQRFIDEHGPHHAIFDFSPVEDFRLSNELARRIGDMDPAIPAPMQRIVIVPQPALYGTAREVQSLRAFSPAAIRIVKTIGSAYELLGIADPGERS